MQRALASVALSMILVRYWFSWYAVHSERIGNSRVMTLKARDMGILSVSVVVLHFSIRIS